MKMYDGWNENEKMNVYNRHESGNYEMKSGKMCGGC